MKVSTKGRYGLRAMLDLAMHSQDGHVALFNIGERQGISTNYLEQVFSTLRKAGLVKSVKGAQGGYTLSAIPSEIKVGRILRALEGPLSVIDENPESAAANETDIQRCVRVCVWDKMNEALNELVDSMTLEDLVENYKKANGLEETMYYI